MIWYKWKLWRIAYSLNVGCEIKDVTGEWVSLFKNVVWLKKRAKVST